MFKDCTHALESDDVEFRDCGALRRAGLKGEISKMQTIETRIRQLTAAMAVMLMTAMSTGAVAAQESGPHVKSGYAPVNGLKMYYEIHGAANGKKPPLVLLHGGGSTIDTTFGKVLPSLGKDPAGHRLRAARTRPHRRHRRSPVHLRAVGGRRRGAPGASQDRDKPISSASAMAATSPCRSPSGIRAGCASWWSPRPCSNETGSIPRSGNS